MHIFFISVSPIYVRKSHCIVINCIEYNRNCVNDFPAIRIVGGISSNQKFSKFSFYWQKLQNYRQWDILRTTVVLLRCLFLVTHLAILKGRQMGSSVPVVVLRSLHSGPEQICLYTGIS